MPKEQTNFRLSAEARKLLRKLAARDGLSMASWLETNLRRIAREQGVTLSEKPRFSFRHTCARFAGIYYASA